MEVLVSWTPSMGRMVSRTRRPISSVSDPRTLTKKAMSLPNPTFYKTVNVQGSKVKSQAIRVRFSLSGESFSLFKV